MVFCDDTDEVGEGAGLSVDMMLLVDPSVDSVLLRR